MRALTLFVGVIAAACGAGASQAIELGREYTLAPGEHVGGTDLTLRFDAVPADSRCPSDVQCIWEGDATVAVTVLSSSLAPCAVELHTATSLRGDKMCGPYALRLIGLSPERGRAGSPIGPQAYRATVVAAIAR